MARRDVLRAKGLSTLIVLMVLLPVTLISYAITGLQAEWDGPAAVENSLGGAQARIDRVDTNVVIQDAKSNFSSNTEKPATPIPGFRADSTPQENAAALGNLLNATVVPQVVSLERAIVGDRKVDAVVQSVASPTGLAPKVELLSGRWPSSPEEALVTPRGEHDGLPTSGRVTLSKLGTERQVTIVGTASGRLDYEMASLVSVPSEQTTETDEVSWLVVSDRPILWDDVRRLNTYGLSMLSRAVLADPPDEAELSPEVRDMTQSEIRDLALILAVSGFLLFFFCGLMVAPAFAVGAARQRRTLALIASNGATTRQLRRSTLAQAVLLGAMTAALGVALGIALVALQIFLTNHYAPWRLPGTLTVPSVTLVGLWVVAAIAVVGSALIPATRLGRLDIVGVMRGQSVSPPASRRLPVLGLTLGALGAGTTILTFAAAKPSQLLALLGMAALLIGAILTIPMALVIAASLARKAPLAIRMAARDAARHRPRAVPTVAALMAGAAILTVAGVAAGSDEAQAKRDYLPQLPSGEMALNSDYGLDPTGEDLRDNIDEYARGLASYEVNEIGLTYDETAEGKTSRERFMLIAPPGCTASQTITAYAAVTDTREGNPTCALSGSHALAKDEFGLGETPISVLPLAQMIRLYDLDTREAKIVRDGGVLSSDSAITRATDLRLLSGSVTLSARDEYGKVTTESARKLSVVPITAAQQRANGDIGAAMIVSLEAVTENRWPTYGPTQRLYDPAGPISEAMEESITSQLPDGVVPTMERGYTNQSQNLIIGFFVVAGLLMVVVTLVATALAVSEQQGDLATLASVGATRRTRRRTAAAQAALIALLGSVLGIVIGMAPGIAFTFPLTGESIEADGSIVSRDPLILIPWLPLLGIVVFVPLIAATLAALAIRRSPAVTHRTT
jgi:putative ABC transport system permease protein